MKVLTEVSTCHQPVSTDDLRKATIIQSLMDYLLTQIVHPMQSSLSLPTQLCLCILRDILNVFTNKSTTRLNVPLLPHIQLRPFVSSAACLSHLLLMVATTTLLDTATHCCSSMPSNRTCLFPASNCHWPPLDLQPSEADWGFSHSFFPSMFNTCCVPTTVYVLGTVIKQVRFPLNSSEVRI